MACSQRSRKSLSSPSSALSCAVASRPCTNAASVARRRIAGSRLLAVTLAVAPNRAREARRLGGMHAAVGSTKPKARTTWRRKSACTNAGPLTVTGPVRSWSRREVRRPSGTVSRLSRCACGARLTPRPRTRHRRTSTRLRRRATQRSSMRTPGNSTLCVRSQAMARSHHTLGRSVPGQHKAYSQRLGDIMLLGYMCVSKADGSQPVDLRWPAQCSATHIGADPTPEGGSERA
jgi:hypothetical protein